MKVTPDVYPVFEISSIINRCHKEITQFTTLYKIDDPYNIVLNDSTDMKRTIDSIAAKILKLTHKKSMKQFNYHEIVSYSIAVQYKLWILRSYLFYQLLLFSTIIMSNQELFDEIYKKKRTFRPEITSELHHFKMGIFGSIKPTSDIDLGIQYSGFKIRDGLSYVVAVFEDSFIHFLGISSLELDIETYADMMTLPDYHADIFYLDTVKFGMSELKQMLPYAGASVIRNYVTAYDDVKRIDTFDFSLISDFRDFHFREVRHIFEDTQWQDKARELVKTYMTKDYETAREHYYTLVSEAEESLQGIKHKIRGRQLPTTREILNSMMKIAESLVFRAESYTCAPTVMHIVRVLQANKNHPFKYPTVTPSFCKLNKHKAIYSIGKVGYILSMIEQIGYILRVDIAYCKHDDPKCSKKEKYTERYDNAVRMYNQFKKLHVSCTKKRRVLSK